MGRSSAGSPGRVTIYDVARHAGVSQTTVTQVLNGKRPVSQATKDKVHRSITALGYRPNEVARSLRSSRTQSVALVVPNISHTLYPFVARAVGAELHSRGYQMVIYDTDRDPQAQREIIDSLAARGADGVIVFGYSLTPSQAGHLRRIGLPFVNGGLNEEARPDWDTVRSDQRSGIRAMVRRAAARTDGTIAYIGGLAGDGPADLRADSWRSAMRELGRPVAPEHVLQAPYSPDGGADACRRLLDLPAPPSAIVCANDLIAFGAISTIAGRGGRVPEDLSVSGYDNTDYAHASMPPLTTVETFPDRQGYACTTRLLEAIAAPPDARTPPTHTVLGVEPVYRASA